jgi:DNA polymerase
VRQRSAFGDADELGVRSVALDAEDVVADLEQADRRADRFDLAGQLLNRLLEGIGLRREDVYICNVVKSRPPQNRDPQPDEIAACRPWLDAQIRLVDPRVVVTLGNFAAKTLLETTTGITRLRGQTYPFQGRVLLPTFHPAAALHAQGRRTAGPSPLEAMEGDFKILAELLAARAPVDEDRPTEQLGLF